MSLAKKLNLSGETKLQVIAKPADVALDDVEVTRSTDAGGILVFVKTLREVDAKCGAAIAVARHDGLAWIAYPKAGQLATDLNRDVLWKHLSKQGIAGVRQIAIDDVWSAMRFRPSK